MEIPTKDLCFRIVTKLHDGLHNHEADEKGRLVLIGDDAPSNQLAKLIPGKSIDRLFTSLSAEQVMELRRKAMKADHYLSSAEFS